MPLSKEKRVKLPKRAKKGDLPQKKEDWPAYVNDLHEKGLEIRRKHEFQWAINLAYYLGYQHLVFNYATASIQVPRSVSRPLTINRIGAFVEERLAKLTKSRPFPSVIPNSNDKEDLNAAKFAEKALKSLWYKIDEESEYEKLVILGLIYGTSFKRTVWDPFAGESVVEIKEAKIPGLEGIVDLEDDGTPKVEEIFMGEVCSKALSPFALIPADESITDIKDQPWIMERSWHHASELIQMYPHLEKEIVDMKEEEKTAYELIVDKLSSPTAASTGTVMHKVHDTLNESLLVKTLWIKPNYIYPKGLVCVVIGNKTAFLDEFPHNYGSNIYPFAKFNEKTDGVHFWGQSTVERLTSIQRAYNKLRQKKLKNAEDMANGKVLLPKGSQVMEDSFDDDSGEIIEYNPSVPKPEQMQLAPLPNYVVELARELIVDFRDAGGQRETSVKIPSNIVAGVAMQINAELQDEAMTPIIRRLSRAQSVAANQQLILMEEEYIEDRKILIFGEGNAVGVQWMSSADFRHHTDIHIEVESMFPDFRGSKQQRLFDLWDRRVVTDPISFLKALRFGNFDQLIEDIEKEEDPVAIDIKAIKDGKQPEVTPFQNHATYFRVMSKWIQSPEFLRLPPDRKELAVFVLQQHMQFLIPSLPGGGAPVEEQNQAAVGSEQGSIKPVGAA